MHRFGPKLKTDIPNWHTSLIELLKSCTGTLTLLARLDLFELWHGLSHSRRDVTALHIFFVLLQGGRKIDKVCSWWLGCG